MSKFNNILLVKKDRMDSLGLIGYRKVMSYLDDYNFECVNVNSLERERFNRKDLVISLGGDGTFLRSASYLRDVPIVGINLNPEKTETREASEGFLTSFDIKEHSLLNEVLEGNYNMIKRDRAEAERNGSKLDQLALNEVYVGIYRYQDTARYEMAYRGIKEDQKSHGVIISTGSGSTAMYSSKGGNAFSYDSKCLKFLVDASIQLSVVNCKNIKGEILENEEIVFKSYRYGRGIMWMDGDDRSERDFNEGDIVKVRLSKHPLNVIVPNKKK